MKEIGLIIKMPTEQANKEEIEYRKSKFCRTLVRWSFEKVCKENGLEDILKGIELMNAKYSKRFDKY